MFALHWDYSSKSPCLSPGGITANIKNFDLLILLSNIAIMSLISPNPEVLAFVGLLPLKLDSL